MDISLGLFGKKLAAADDARREKSEKRRAVAKAVRRAKRAARTRAEKRTLEQEGPSYEARAF